MIYLLQDIYCEEVPFDGTDNFETDDIQEPSLTCIQFNEFYDISQACFKEMVDIYVDSMSITFAEISEVEKNTRGQISSEHWWNYGKERLTASKFYSAEVNTVEPSKTSLKRLKDPHIRKRNMNEDKKVIIKKKRKLITDWLNEYITGQPNKYKVT